MLNIYPVPALDSNYFWLLQPDSAEPAAYIIDPGAAGPVITAVDSHQLQLAGIIVTHHHHDHIGGINELVERYNLPVYGPRSEEHTSELQSRENLVCRLLLEKKKQN